MSLSPAEYVIQVFGGVRATARAIGRSPSSISKWQKPRSQGGSDGCVPNAAQRIILEQAKKQGLDITPGDLIYGRNNKRRS